MVITLSKLFLLITNEFSIKFRNFPRFWNFEILFRSRVMSYESFYEKCFYDSYMTHHICNIHRNDCKFYFRFSDAKIFEIRPRKIFKSIFHQNAWAEYKFWLQIRIQRKIPRRMVCVDMGSILILPTICMKIKTA